jgi:hypothetical protein
MMGKMGDTWRRVETSTKTGETDQGVPGLPEGCPRWSSASAALHILTDAVMKQQEEINTSIPGPKKHLEDVCNGLREINQSLKELVDCVKHVRQ